MKYKKYLSLLSKSLIAAFLISSFSGCITFPERRRINNLEQIASHPNYFVNSAGMEFRRMPAGEFMMGTRESKNKYTHWRVEIEERERWLKFYCDNERPKHNVRITNDFYMQTTEVTRKQFSKFVKETGYLTDAEKKGWAFAWTGKKWDRVKGVSWKSPEFEVEDGYPIAYLMWEDANEFCKWLSKKENCNYRLPTEAEWEYTCRAGTTTEYNTGRDTITHDDANFYGVGGRDLWEEFSPVGSFRPNNWGLYDMHGNVWEFCSDWFDDEYYYHTPKEDPQGYIVEGSTKGFYHSLRGGGWNFTEMELRTANRTEAYPMHSNAGFRCAMELRKR